MTHDTLDIGLVMAGWAAMAIIFAFKRRPSATAERRREHASLIGIALQGAGFALAWGMRRAPGTPMFPIFLPLRWAVTGVIGTLVGVSVVMLATAVTTLGKQWSLAARVLEEHELIIAGPFRFVRHPIYTAMFGLMIATALVFATGTALAASVVLYVLGTTVRISLEERLLRGQFGAAFEDYARRVPALFPVVRLR